MLLVPGQTNGVGWMLRWWCWCGEAGIGDVSGEGGQRQEQFVKAAAEVAKRRRDELKGANKFKRGSSRSRLRLRWTAMVLMVEMISVVA